MVSTAFLFMMGLMSVCSTFITHEGDVFGKQVRRASHCVLCLWPSSNGTVSVPYTFSYNYSADQLALFQSAMQEIESLTCVRFVPRTTETDYLNITSNKGCLSYIGKMGGAQRVDLAAPACMYRGIIQHELNKALGIYHEQDFTGNLWNSNKMDTNNLGQKSDYNSLMHYARDAFTNTPGKDTITPKSSTPVYIEQRYGLSVLDVSEINRLYNCSVCGNLLPYTNGTMTSANYPSAYPNDANCVWLIRTPSGQVSLQFQAFDIQSSPGCTTDYIKIYDGPSKTSPVLVDKACGTGLIPLQIASTNQMLVEFVSDGAIAGTGFKATYSSVQCGGAYYVSGKTFTTPGYPGDYPPNVDCTWTITAPVGYKILLKITDFEVQTSYLSCRNDNVYIYNTTIDKVLGPYCASVYFYTVFTSKANFLKLTFHSDNSIERKGFRASYLFFPKE